LPADPSSCPSADEDLDEESLEEQLSKRNGFTITGLVRATTPDGTSDPPSVTTGAKRSPMRT